MRTLVLGIAVAMVATAGADEFIPQPLFTMNLDGSNLREVANPPGRTCGSPQWSPDGKRIAFDSVIPPFNDIHVYVVELENGAVTKVGPGAFPSWSPDGQLIALMRTTENEYGTWIVQPDGSEPTRLFTEGTHPRWSPDGESISYRNRSGELALYRLTLGDHRTLHQDPGEKLRWGRSWSPDGKQIAVGVEFAQKDLEIKFLSPGKEPALGPGRFRGNLSSHLNWSPDGKHLLVGLYFPGNGPRHLHLLEIAGNGPPQLIPNQDMKYDYCDGAWSPDGKQITFSRKIH